MPRATFERVLAALPHALRVTLVGLGEPLLHPELGKILDTCAQLDFRVCITTNGTLLAAKAKSLKDAGLTRLTVSLDALDDALFRRMNDMDHSVAEVLAGMATGGGIGEGER